MIPVWAETGDFRDNNHHGLSADHTSQLNFGSSRSRNRDRKGEDDCEKINRVHVINDELDAVSAICFFFTTNPDLGARGGGTRFWAHYFD